MTRHFCLDDSPRFRWLELDEVDSTNNYLKRYRPFREVPLTLVTAEHQSAGRGAGENRWESEQGKNLLFSILWLPEAFPARHVFALSEVLALAIRDALNDFQPSFTIKWPNDIYYDDWKVVGTLIENELTGKCVSRSIMGTGINVNQTSFVSDAPNPRSLAQIVGHDVERRDVLQGVMFHFDRYLRMLQREQYADIHTEYMQHIYRWNALHTYEDANGQFKACITDIELDGHLVLTDGKGVQRRYAFKEVAFIHNSK